MSITPPKVREDWEVSTRQEEGFDPMLVAQLYLNAEDVHSINNSLVFKDDKPIAEKYYNDGDIDLDQKNSR